MPSYDHPTRSGRDDTPKALNDEHHPPKAEIYYSKVVYDAKPATALFAAIEVLTWQLVTRGVLPADPLADELTRHARFLSGGEKSLQLLAHVTRAAGYPPLVSARPELPRWDRRSRQHG